MHPSRRLRAAIIWRTSPSRLSTTRVTAACGNQYSIFRSALDHSAPILTTMRQGRTRDYLEVAGSARQRAADGQRIVRRIVIDDDDVESLLRIILMQQTPE